MKNAKRVLVLLLSFSISMAAFSPHAMFAKADTSGQTGVQTTGQTAASPLTLTSSNNFLVASFNWAKSTALGYVQTGKTTAPNFGTTTVDTMPSYSAGYPWRDAFCVRDFSHMAVGAHLLGLDTENYDMLSTFAATATAARGYFPLWEMCFDGTTPLALDYKTDTNFVREIPGVFQLVSDGDNLYRWTGDSNYVNNATLTNYYSNVMTKILQPSADGGVLDANGVASSTATSIWNGVISYNEQSRSPLFESGDGIGTQYQAYLAYSDLAAAAGDTTDASAYAAKAAALQSYYSTNWFNATDNTYDRGFTSTGSSYDDFGKENSWFMPMERITDPGTKTTNYLNYIDSQCQSTLSSPFNIEAYSYLPEVFYPWGQNDTAWKWLKYVMGSRTSYPEISFETIGDITTQLMGIQAYAAENKVTTDPRLPTGNVSQVAWVDLNHIKVGQNDIEVKHEGNGKTTFTNNSGPSALDWEADFDGSFPTLTVNGTSICANTKTVNGVTISYVTVPVAVGASAVVTTGAALPAQASIATDNAVQNADFESGTSGWTFTGDAGVAATNPHAGAASAYINAGAGNEASQTASVLDAGTYTLSGWFSSGGGGTFGARVNGNDAGTVPIPKGSAYGRLSIPGIVLNTGDSVEIYATGPDSGSTDMDDISLTPVNKVMDPGFERAVPPAVALNPNELLTNPSFETQTGPNTGWTFTQGQAGFATNAPHIGLGLAYINTGTANTISQTVTAATTGTYTASVWVSSSGSGGVFGVSVNNGASALTVPIPRNQTYNQLTIPNIALNAGDTIQVYATGATSGWVNVDDFSLTTSGNVYSTVAPTLTPSAWRFSYNSNGTLSGLTRNPNTGVYSGYITSGTKESNPNWGMYGQMYSTDVIGTAGTYTLSGYLSATDAPVGTTLGRQGIFGVLVNGVDEGSVSVNASGSYQQYTVPNISVNAGDCVDVYVKGSTDGSVYADDISLTRNSVVTFNTNGGTAVSAESVVYNGNAGKPADPSRAGYAFAGWYSDNGTFANPFDFDHAAVTADTTVYAKWTAVPQSAGGGSAPVDTTVTGTAGSNGAATASISSADTDASTVANVIVTLGTATVTAPSSVFSGVLGGDSAGTLQLSQAPSPAATQAQVAAAAAAGGSIPISTLDFDLTRISSAGTSEAVHALGGSVTVTIRLTDAQIAQIADVSRAHLFYYDPATGLLTDMGAVFDLTAKTVTFVTNHFSTYVIAAGSAAATVGVTYDAHVQRTGWQPYVNDGAEAGTDGKALRVEALNVKLTGTVPAGASVTYQAHVQTQGWQKAVANGAEVGTVGKALRLEALKITLSGLPGYAVEYRAHVQGIGWMPWQTTANGTALSAAAEAGTVGKALRLEAIEIKIVKAAS